MRELRFASASIRPHICFPSLLLFLLLLSLPLSQSQPASFRGIRKRDQALYIAANFTCFDSSASFPSSRVNDDYCDCADGSDEPGTSACPNSSFFCPNRGASSLSIHSSRVNDLICDCCDGSDEWASRGGPAACPNRCAEEGREKHKHVLEEIAATEAGVKTRQQLVEEAMRTKAEKEGKKAKYEATVADRQKVLDDAKGQPLVCTISNITRPPSVPWLTAHHVCFVTASLIDRCVQLRWRSRRRLSRQRRTG